MKSFLEFVAESKVWCVDVSDRDGTSPAGPFRSETEARKYIKAMEAHASSGEKYECSEPYEADESHLYESMDNDEKKEFYSKLQRGKVRFQYRKKNGELRDAYGTLKEEFLPPPAHPSDTRASARDRMKRKFPEDSVFYYDLDKEGFRSFKMKLFEKYLD